MVTEKCIHVVGAEVREDDDMKRMHPNVLPVMSIAQSIVICFMLVQKGAVEVRERERYEEYNQTIQELESKVNLEEILLERVKFLEREVRAWRDEP